MIAFGHAKVTPSRLKGFPCFTSSGLPLLSCSRRCKYIKEYDRSDSCLARYRGLTKRVTQLTLALALNNPKPRPRDQGLPTPLGETTSYLLWCLFVLKERRKKIEVTTSPASSKGCYRSLLRKGQHSSFSCRHKGGGEKVIKDTLICVCFLAFARLFPLKPLCSQELFVLR